MTLELFIPILAATALSIVKALFEKLSVKKQDSRVEEAEKRAFDVLPKELVEKIERVGASQAGLEVKTRELTDLIDSSRGALVLGNLFNLYNRQIEKYQDETRSRASWSFYIALIAMFAGFGFVFWGGQHVLTEPSLNHLAAGSAIAAIGGAISAYITKTFLDVHKVSLQQLNRYFAQPVINDHILMAQRLADALPNDSPKQEAYEGIIASVTALIGKSAHEPSEEQPRESSRSPKGRLARATPRSGSNAE